jgi:hypothetical protein
MQVCGFIALYLHLAEYARLMLSNTSLYTSLDGAAHLDGDTVVSCSEDALLMSISNFAAAELLCVMQLMSSA